MVLPQVVLDAVLVGRIGPVRQWFEGADAGEAQAYLNATDVETVGYWLMRRCVVSSAESENLIKIMRYLVSRGADVNLIDRFGVSALHSSCYGALKPPVIRFLLAAGADPNIRTRELGERAPLEILIQHGSMKQRSGEPFQDRILDLVADLLRAGAQIPTPVKLNEIMSANHDPKIRALVESVRLHGSWRLHCRAPHKRLLALRSLVARGRATTTAATPMHVKWLLAPQFPNDLVWLVLEYWSPTD